MAKNERVHSAHNSGELKELHSALLSILAEMNRRQRDAEIIRDGGIPLDRALFPLLVRIEREGPIGVVELADSVGRNYTSVSRQVAKLEELGFVSRQPGVADKRVRESVITDRGRALTDKVDIARARIGHAIFDSWSEQDVSDLVRLMLRFAKDLQESGKGA